MALYRLYSAELRSPAGEAYKGDFPHSSLIVFDTVVKRTGGASFRAAPNTAAYVNLPTSAVPLPNAIHNYFRVYIRFSAWPTTNRRVGVARSSGDVKAIELTPTGQIRFEGETPSTPLSLNTWHRLEVRVVRNVSGGTGEVELRIDGTVVQLWGGGSVGNFQALRVGYTAGGVAQDGSYYLDDIACADSSGASHNTWVGPGRVHTLKPVADVAAGADWRRGDNTAVVNGFDSINNTPPTGKADASAAAGDQLEDAVNAVAAPAADMDVQVQSLAEAGIGGRVEAMQIYASFAHGGSAPATMNAGLKFVSNPVAAEDVRDTKPGINAGANWPGNWDTALGSLLDLPTVDPAVRPTIRVAKREATAVALLCAFAGVLVEESTGAPSTRFKVTTTAASNQITPALPAHETGDVIVCHLVSDDQTVNLTNAGGWIVKHTQDGQDHKAWLVYKVAQSAAEASPTFTLSGSSNLQAVVTSFKDANPADPFDAVAGVVTQPAAVNHVLPSLTLKSTDDLLVGLASLDAAAGASWTPPGGMVERYDEDSLVGGRHLVSTMADERRSASGATGTRTFNSGASENVAGIAFALRSELQPPVPSAKVRPRVGGRRETTLRRR